MRGGAGGEIVQVEGGHIVRSTGRKDRHSKVCTAKGPRDRRVRLSAHTAIQFYDVQDRLGYDRPSKAVDWLIKKAKTAIDELAKLPPWNPIATVTTTTTTTTTTNNNNNNPNGHHNEEEEETENPIRRRVMMADGGSPSRPTVGNGDGVNVDHEGGGGGGGGGGSGFFSPSLEVDIADTISSFFPTKTTSSLPIRFQSYTPDLLSRTSNNNQDLRLSLQSLQDPILLHQHQAQNYHHHHHHQNQNEHVLFPGTTALGFDGMVAWNAGTDTGGHVSGDAGGGCGGGFVFNTPSPSPSPVTQPALLFGQSQYLSQRGPLQSSNNPSIRAWIDAPSITAATATTVADHHHHHVLHHYLSPAMMHQSVPGIGFASGGFSGFRVPARIQGEVEEHDGVSDMPSSASSDSRH